MGAKGSLFPRHHTADNTDSRIYLCAMDADPKTLHLDPPPQTFSPKKEKQPPPSLIRRSLPIIPQCPLITPKQLALQFLTAITPIRQFLNNRTSTNLNNIIRLRRNLKHSIISTFMGTIISPFTIV